MGQRVGTQFRFLSADETYGTACSLLETGINETSGSHGGAFEVTVLWDVASTGAYCFSGQGESPRRQPSSGVKRLNIGRALKRSHFCLITGSVVQKVEFSVRCEVLRAVKMPVGYDTA